MAAIQLEEAGFDYLLRHILAVDVYKRQKQDLGIDNIFAEDVIYTESWSPKYNNRQIVKHWFQEWNTRGKVVVWEIKQFFHKGNKTIVRCV